MRLVRDARDDLIDTLRAQLVGTEAQLAEVCEALDALAIVPLLSFNIPCADLTCICAGASTSRGAPDLEITSLRDQLAAAVTRAEAAERDLSARSDELQSALTWEMRNSAEMTELS
ncbi:hypothetical protein Taro_036439 [Colocasia esculenta]|uniref:Uncharacterized protein n=1 Tax=Colocasia esculenta TaxID=4460 RepID=A0A843WLN3_COLES|nr:hypothetical protein [Colocasia esculenta]